MHFTDIIILPIWIRCLVLIHKLNRAILSMLTNYINLNFYAKCVAGGGK